MHSASKEVFIEATPREILDVLVDVESLPEWYEGYESVEVLDRDAAGRPHRVRSTMVSTGMNDEQVVAYTWHDDGVSWVLESSKMQKAQEARYTLTPHGDGTNAKFDISIELNMKLPSFIIKKGAELMMRTATDSLGERVLKLKANN